MTTAMRDRIIDVTMWAILAVASLVLLWLLLLLAFRGVDAAMGDRQSFTATVVGREFVAESSSVGSGFASNGKGGVGPVMVSSHSPEQHIVILQSERFGVVPVDVPIEHYVDVKEGDDLSCSARIGRWSGDPYFVSISQ